MSRKRFEPIPAERALVPMKDKRVKSRLNEAVKAETGRRKAAFEQERVGFVRTARAPGVLTGPRSFIHAIQAGRRQRATAEQAEFAASGRTRLEQLKLQGELAVQEARLNRARLEREAYGRAGAGALRVEGGPRGNLRLVRRPGPAPPRQASPGSVGGGMGDLLSAFGMGAAAPPASPPPLQRSGYPSSGLRSLAGGFLSAFKDEAQPGPAGRPPPPGVPSDQLEFVPGYYRQARPDKILARQLKRGY